MHSVIKLVAMISSPGAVIVRFILLYEAEIRPHQRLQYFNTQFQCSALFGYLYKGSCEDSVNGERRMVNARLSTRILEV